MKWKDFKQQLKTAFSYQAKLFRAVDYVFRVGGECFNSLQCWLLKILRINLKFEIIKLNCWSFFMTSHVNVGLLFIFFQFRPPEMLLSVFQQPGESSQSTDDESPDGFDWRRRRRTSEDGYRRQSMLILD